MDVDPRQLNDTPSASHGCKRDVCTTGVSRLGDFRSIYQYMGHAAACRTLHTARALGARRAVSHAPAPQLRVSGMGVGGWYPPPHLLLALGHFIMHMVWHGPRYTFPLDHLIGLFPPSSNVLGAPWGWDELKSRWGSQREYMYLACGRMRRPGTMPSSASLPHRVQGCVRGWQK